MLAQERQAIILEMLREKGVVKISDIAERFGVSGLTARRDLDVLMDEGLARRVYGGAVLCREPAVPLQENGAAAESIDAVRCTRRSAIVREAMKLVREGDRIHLGNGIVVEELARELRHFQRLSIVTGSLSAANQLLGSNHEVFLLGGQLHHDEQNLTGNYAMQMSRDFHTNITFIPCAGITAEFGVMSDYLPAAELGRVAVENTEKAVLLCRCNSIGRVTFHKVCPVSALDVIITDEGITPEQKAELEAQGVQVIVARTNQRQNK